MEVVVGRQLGDRPECRLPAFPQHLALGFGSGHPDRLGVTTHGDLLDEGRLGLHSGGLSDHFDEEDGGPIGGETGLEPVLHGLHHPLIHHLQGGGDTAGGDDVRDRAAGVLDPVEVDEQGPDIGIDRDQPHQGPGHHPQGALGTDDQPFQIQTRGVGRQPAEHHHLATGENHLETQDVAGGAALGETMGAPTVVGDVAPDGAGGLR